MRKIPSTYDIFEVLRGLREKATEAGTEIVKEDLTDFVAEEEEKLERMRTDVQFGEEKMALEAVVDRTVFMPRGRGG